MEPHRPDEPGPIEAVLFDLHQTLVDQGDPGEWLALAWARARRSGSPAEQLPPGAHARLAQWVNHLWEHASEVDPHGERDLSPIRHRQVYDALTARQPELDPELAGALYQVLLEPWFAYDDAGPTLRELRRRGLKLAVVSNVGLDVRPVLVRGGLDGLLDAVVLSCEAGVVKPDPAIFQRALDALGVAPDRALMVGDNARDDGGAARLGIRTLILPRTRGRVHGLELVLRLVAR